MSVDSTVDLVSRLIDESAASRRRRALDRLAILVSAIVPMSREQASAQTTRDLVAAVARFLAPPTEAHVWLCMAVLAARLPLEEEVIDAVRQSRLDGLDAMLIRLTIGFAAVRWLPIVTSREVEVVTAGVLVDVDHTSTVQFATGIQRVVRETVARWVRDHDPILVGWTADKSALRRLSDSECSTVVTGTTPGRADSSTSIVSIPWGPRVAYVLPELNIDQESTRRISALARWSGARSTVIGFDTVPLSSPETTDAGMPAAFANNLIAVRQMDTVLAISNASAAEYRGWLTMLGSTGIAGPEVVSLPLGYDHGSPTARNASTRALSSTTREIPLALCVGSHEPRKNHLAVLQAAELLWQQGLAFELLFVGGNAWNSDPFLRRLTALSAAGRPVSRRTSISDAELDALYEDASFTVFPSLNEGYGLPVVESLRRRTPVITSDFGSMLGLGVDAGAIFVDPRDDESIVSAMRMLLTEPARRLNLVAQTTTLAGRSWDDYAEEAWVLSTRDL